MMKRKLGLITATVALGALLAVGGTLAWFADTQTASNTVTLGNVKIMIQEQGPNDSAFVDITGDVVGRELGENQTPGQVLTKKVRIKNNGANDAYIRVKVTEDSDLDYTPNSTDWIDGNDGYYYYSKKVTTTGDTAFTSLFIEDVTIPDTWGNTEIDSELAFDIQAEAIQADNVIEAGTGPVTITADDIADLKEAFGDDADA